MCELGYHSCPKCEDTSPCDDGSGANPNCSDPIIFVCNMCKEKLK